MGVVMGSRIGEETGADGARGAVGAGEGEAGARAWTAIPIDVPMHAREKMHTKRPMMRVLMGLSVHRAGSVEYLSAPKATESKRRKGQTSAKIRFPNSSLRSPSLTTSQVAKHSIT
jgi:hypothetical protein